MVEWGGLENRCASDRTQGSNPCLSATILMQKGSQGCRMTLAWLCRYIRSGVLVFSKFISGPETKRRLQGGLIIVCSWSKGLP